ncbi:sigma-E processing peptidase SpoIIGA [Selenomonadales bacterium OttesenSCG-928-I06]|nr:sigma-E processing peptidase SpoIIGA [Selenomonadales bacterium OttesenSCG-928-I06]
MHIYGDIIILINLIMNTFILVLTGFTAKKSYSFSRIILAAFIGSIYSLLEFNTNLSILYTIPFKILFSIFIVLLAFKIQNLRSFLILFSLFFIVSFATAGTVFFLIYLTNSNLMEITSILASCNFIHLCIGTFLIFILIYLTDKHILKNINTRNNSYIFYLKFNNKIIKACGLLDTGNSLHSITNNKPVILINLKKILELLSDETQNFLNNNYHTKWLENIIELKDDDFLKKLEIIPYKTISSQENSLNKQQDTLLGFRADEIIIITNESKITSENIVVGITTAISNENDGYDALLHPLLFNNINVKKETIKCVLDCQ